MGLSRLRSIRCDSSAQLQVRYDASALEVEGGRPGGLTGDFQAFLVLNDPGLLQLDMARLNALTAGTGSLVEIDLRANDTAVPGHYALDLEWASLNAGGLVLTPQPVSGLDGTDGSVAIEAKPGVAMRKPATQPASLVPPPNQISAQASMTHRSANTPVVP